MDQVDVFILADTFQYSRQSFQNRARLRTPQGWQWISVPLLGRQHGRPIFSVAIENRRDWAAKHRRALQYNYRTTPYYEYYEATFESLWQSSWPELGPLTCRTTRLLHRLCGLASEVVTASSLPGRPDTLLNVLSCFPGETLLVPVRGAEHDAALIPDLQVLDYVEPVYRQNFDGFVAGLSGLDALFNHGPQTRALLREGTTIRALADEDRIR